MVSNVFVEQLAYDCFACFTYKSVREIKPWLSLKYFVFDRLFYSSSQRRVDEFLLRKGQYTPQTTGIMTQSILNMFIRGMRPLSMVEDEGFIEMIQTLAPGYHLPSRKHFTKLMEEKYEDVVQHVKDSLKTCSKLALTTDAWTSVATEAYLGITCHFLTSDWELKSYCLTTKPLTERHTGQNIATWIEETVENFEISPQKIIAIVHDNGSNVVLAARILEEKHGWTSIRCAGHTLQLVVNNALKQPQISKAVGAARCLVEHFKKSELASTALKNKQNQMGAPEHKLVQDVSTRWNSTYYMVSRLLEQRWPITATLSDPSITQRAKQSLDLKPDQWIILEELSVALQPFECATVFLSGESYVTVSALPPIVRGLLKSTQTVFDSTSVKAFQIAAEQEITTRWSADVTVKDEFPSKHLLATALDPRFRRLKFLTAEEKFAVHAKVQYLAQNLKEDSAIIEMKNTVSELNDTPPKSQSVKGALDSLLGSNDSTDTDSEGDSHQDNHNQAVTNEVI